MKDINLGRLEKVSLREVWLNESGDFTPWLAQPDNLKLLGDTLGLALELEAQEKFVGPFRADLLCKDTSDDSWVLVENQLEPTDHRHLGQILTYAAGLQAVSIIWIAERFTDEHRAALDWLNEITAEHIQFFGLEVELWRIGESSKAPKFNIVAKPNDWTKGGGAARIREAELSENRRLQLDFWRGFHEYVLNRDSVIKPTKPRPQHWMNIAIGRTGFHLAAIASMYDQATGDYSSNEFRAEMNVTDRNAKGYFRAIERLKSEIESEFGEPLTWHNPENSRGCRIYVRRSGSLADPEVRTAAYEWLLVKLEKLYAVFAPRIAHLQPEPDAVAE